MYHKRLTWNSVYQNSENEIQKVASILNSRKLMLKILNNLILKKTFFITFSLSKINVPLTEMTVNFRNNKDQCTHDKCT